VIGAPVGPNPTAKTATASCPVGKRVLGGGYLIGGTSVSQVSVSESVPSNAMTWRVKAQRRPGSTSFDFSLTAYAICASTSA
jgi:hypothetical protein